MSNATNATVLARAEALLSEAQIHRAMGFYGMAEDTIWEASKVALTMPVENARIIFTRLDLLTYYMRRESPTVL